MTATRKIVIGLGLAGGAILAAWLLTGDRKRKTKDFVVRKAQDFKQSIRKDKASVDNERNALVITIPGARIAVVQIAGLIARRIVCFVRMGQPIGAGERFGMIRFGSRVDVYLPEGVPPLVAVGQTATAGETVLADLRAAGDGGRAFRTG